MSEAEAPEHTGSSEVALIEARRHKAERVRAARQNPFANDVPMQGRSRLAELRARCASALVDAVEQRYDPGQVEALAASGVATKST
jgi:hypothetical protein